MYLKILLSLCLLTSRLEASWVEVTNKPTVLQSEVVISYKIDDFDPARFNDIHSLLYAGSELLFAARVSGGEGVIRVPCGVVTHAGVHSVTLCYTNNTVIARSGPEKHVVWLPLKVSPQDPISSSLKLSRDLSLILFQAIVNSQAQGL